jgi:predicted nucleotidyltransferase
MDRLRGVPGEQIEKIKQVINLCLEKGNDILFAYLHGSFAEGRPFRDIDITAFVEEAKLPKEKTHDFEISLSIKLEETIKMPIDVKVINYAPLAFQYFSTAGVVLMCREDDLRVDFLTKMRSLYLDFEFSMEKFRKEIG